MPDYSSYFNACAEKIANSLNIKLIKYKKNIFFSENRNSVFLFHYSSQNSKTGRIRHWYSIRKSKMDFMKNYQQGFFVLFMDGSNSFLLIPLEYFNGIKNDLPETLYDDGRDSHWHMEFFTDISNTTYLHFKENTRNEINVENFKIQLNINAN